MKGVCRIFMSGLILCVLLGAGFTGGAGADDAKYQWLMESSAHDLIPFYEERLPETTAYAGSWEALQQAAESGKPQIVITANITRGKDDETIVFSNAVIIRSEIGDTRFTIDGRGRQILRIQGETPNVPLKDVSVFYALNFIGGAADGDGGNQDPGACGGAIYAAGDLVLLNCTFENNTAGCGGAVFVNGNLRLESSVVRDNRADYGGGIYVRNGDAMLSCDLEFEYPMPGEMTGNKAAFDGGGLYIQNGNAMITGGKIAGNTANDNGGGVCTENGGVSVSGDARISGNNAHDKGGGIYAFNGDSRIAGGKISGNWAAYGGGVYIYKGNYFAAGGVVTGNEASADGREIYGLECNSLD